MPCSSMPSSLPLAQASGSSGACSTNHPGRTPRLHSLDTFKTCRSSSTAATAPSRLSPHPPPSLTSSQRSTSKATASLSSTTEPSFVARTGLPRPSTPETNLRLSTLSAADPAHASFHESKPHASLTHRLTSSKERLSLNPGSTGRTPAEQTETPRRYPSHASTMRRSRRQSAGTRPSSA